MPPVAGAIAGGLASAAGAKLLSGGGGSRRVGGARVPSPETNLATAPIRNINSTGFSTNLNPLTNRLTLSRSGGVQDVINRLKANADQTVAGINPLLAQVEPGAGRLSEATDEIFGQALSRLQAERDRSVGDLRSSLARRRLLGSSFANDAVNRRLQTFQQAEQELTAQQNQAQASNFLQELDLRTKLIQDRAEARRSAIATELDQVNLESQIAGSVSGNLNSIIQSGSRTLAELEAQRAANRGAFFQPVVDTIGGTVSDAVSNFFTPELTPIDTSSLPAFR